MFALVSTYSFHANMKKIKKNTNGKISAKTIKMTQFDHLLSVKSLMNDVKL